MREVAYTSRKYLSDSREIDISSLGIGADQLHFEAVADIHALRALRQHAFYSRSEHAHEASMLSDPGNDRIEGLADAVADGDGSDALCHLALNFSRGIFFHGTSLGDLLEFVDRIRAGLI